MARTTFSGPVRSLAGFVPAGYKNQVIVAGNAITLAVLSSVNSTTGTQTVGNAGKLNLLNEDYAAGAGTIKLPVVQDATPSDPTSPDQQNEFGATISLYFALDVVNDCVISCAAGDVLTGTGLMIGAAGAVTGFQASAAAGNNTMTFNGTTKGGLIDTEVHITPISANTWYVNVVGMGSGTTVSPFSTV
jgi:hypothetical protein|tara:strand:+ start:2183 stop:2749 length:567 start_codon:yes stop_codon:yes gene_type:complete